MSLELGTVPLRVGGRVADDHVDVAAVPDEGERARLRWPVWSGPATMTRASQEHGDEDRSGQAGYRGYAYEQATADAAGLSRWRRQSLRCAA